MKRQLCDPFVFTRKAPFMQRVADLVGTGHTRYVGGQISLEKAAFFATKMDLLYDCFSNRFSQCRSRKKGNSTGRLLFWWEDDTTHAYWILLVTEGRWISPDSGNEKWQDPTKERFALTGYEMVRHVRSGNAKPSWTWRYQASRYDEIRMAILQAVRSRHDDDLKRLIDSIWRSPGFAGTREQIKKFRKLINAEWERSRVGDPPEVPKWIRHTRRMADKGKLLSQLRKEHQNAFG
jgi:hypothetical protein